MVRCSASCRHNAGIRGVLSGNKTECAYYFSVFIFANIVGSVGYFSQNQFNGRITVYPLVGVAMLFHELTGTTLREIISQENTHLFFLLADQEIAVCELLQQFLYCIGVGWDKVFYFYYFCHFYS